MVKVDRHETLSKARLQLEWIRQADRVAQHLPAQMRRNIERTADPDIEVERFIAALAFMSKEARRSVEDVWCDLVECYSDNAASTGGQPALRAVHPRRQTRRPTRRPGRGWRVAALFKP